MEAQVWTLIGLLGGTVLCSFVYLGQKIDGLGTRLDGRLDHLSARIDSLDDRLTARIDGLDDRLTGRIDGLSAKLDVHLRHHMG